MATATNIATMSEEEVIEQLLEITRQKGHFQFRNLLHGDVKFVCDDLFGNLVLAIRVTELLIDKLWSKLSEEDAFGAKRQIDGIIGVSGGGKVLATWVGLFLHQKGFPINKVVLTRRQDRGSLMLETGFVVRKHERYLVIEDVVTTGKSLSEAMQLVQTFEGRIVGAAYLIDRSEGKVDLQIPIQVSLVQPRVKQWTAFECPLCQERDPQKKIPLDIDGGVS